MKELFTSAWDMLLFRPEAYERHAARTDVLKRGLALLVLVTLVAGVLSFVIDVIGDLNPESVEARQREMREALEDPWKFLGPAGRNLDIPPEFRKQLPNIRAGIEIGLRVEALPTPLPKFIGRVFQDAGEYLSTPFSRLASWIGYTIWVLLAAKLLGGRATLPQMLGTTAIYAVPHLLGLLDFIPCLNILLGLAATLWGIAIYVQAVAVVNKFSIGRAIAATVLPALVVSALIALIGSVLLVGALLASA